MTCSTINKIINRTPRYDNIPNVNLVRVQGQTLRQSTINAEHLNVLGRQNSLVDGGSLCGGI